MIASVSESRYSKKRMNPELYELFVGLITKVAKSINQGAAMKKHDYASALEHLEIPFIRFEVVPVEDTGSGGLVFTADDLVPESGLAAGATSGPGHHLFLSWAKSPACELEAFCHAAVREEKIYYFETNNETAGGEIKGVVFPEGPDQGKIFLSRRPAEEGRDHERDSIIHHLEDIHFILGEDLVVRRFYTSDKNYRSFAEANLVGRSILTLFPGGFDEEKKQALKKARATGKPQLVSFESHLYQKNRWYDARVSHHSHSGQGYYLVKMTNSTRSRDLHHEVESLASQVDKFFSMELILISIMDTRGRFVRVNKAWEGLLGYSEAELVGVDVREFLHPEDVAFTFKKARQLIEGQETTYVTNRYRAKDGTYRYLEWHSKIEGYLIYSSVRDASDRIKRQEEIEFLDSHDQQTRLLNRKALRIRGEEMNRVTDDGLRWGVYFIDVDNYSGVNNALGHVEGDQILISIAQKIQESFLDRGIAYRYEGDEFVVLSQVREKSELVDQAKKLLSRIASQVSFESRNFLVTASIGVALGGEGDRISDIIENAQTALFKAKRQRNTYAVYEPSLEGIRTRQIILSEDLPGALDKGQFEIKLQPIVSVAKGIVNQAEALLRWRHPELGEISPGEFIPMAESTRLIIPMTEWLVREVCEMLKRFEEKGLGNLVVSINLSALSLENQGTVFFEKIKKILKETGIEASRLKFEITESILIRDSEEIAETLRAMRDLGMKLALDDFGTGYSSFAYLKELPFDVIKIDRSLVSNLHKDSREQILVKSLIAIIHSLGYEVVVEGVETPEQSDIIKAYGGDYIQGFLYSRPVSEDAFLDYCKGTAPSIC